MFHIVLFQPEIPPNTGNIIRLCANIGSHLHLIEPLGFEINDKQLKRAGLDYAKHVSIQTYGDFDAFKQAMGLSSSSTSPPPVYLCTTKATQCYTNPEYKPGSVFVFGPETRGLPPEILDQYPAEQKIKIPMQPGSRSLNLSNAVSVILFEAWRQQGFGS